MSLVEDALLKTLISSTALILTASLAAVAQDADPLAEAINANTYAISFTRDALSGPGGALLNQAARDADILALGEIHGAADVADFAQGWYAAFDAAQPAAYATEIGTLSAPYAAQAMAEGAVDGFRSHVESLPNPLAYAFLFYEEEARLAAHAVRSHGPGALWGLDYEFTASGALFAGVFLDLAETRAQIEAAEQFAASAADPMMVGAVEPEAFDGLAEAFEGVAAAESIIEALRFSNAAYQPFMGRDGSVWTANHIREQRIKANFLDHWRAVAERHRRVFIKLGAGHLMRGVSPTRVSSLGNFLTEWGFSEGASVYSAFVTCDGGETRNPLSGAAHDCGRPMIDGTRFEALASDGPVVVDLAALRPTRAAARASEEERALIFGFDALVILPDVAPSTLLVQPARSE